MRVIEAQYDDGLLRPAEPLHLRRGEVVGVIVVRRPDPKRGDLERLSTSTDGDLDLANTGIEAWAQELDEEDRR